MVSKQRVRELVETYGRAWVEQDPDLVLSVFTPDAVFHEYVLRKPHVGHAAIRKYWVDKVVEEQFDIEFDLLDVFVDGNTAIAEWDVSFESSEEDKRLHLRSVAVMEFEDDLIARQREYWHSERLG